VWVEKENFGKNIGRRATRFVIGKDGRVGHVF